MKRIGSTIVVGLAIAAMSAGAAFADRPDQDSNCNIGYVNVQAAAPLGQTFQPSQDTLTAVELSLAKASDTYTHVDVTVTVREDDFDGAIVGSKTVNVGPLNFDGSRYRFEFDSPLTVVPDTTYMLQIEAANFGVGINYGECGYDRGQPYASFGIGDNMDLNFATFGPCGNGELDTGEICDDGDTINPCCAFPSCEYASTDTACEFDDNDCTDDHCDGAGACTFDNAASGAECPQDADPCVIEACDGAGACVSSTNADVGTPCIADDNLCTTDGCVFGVCHASDIQDFFCSAAPKASLTMVDSAKPGKDKVKFKWSKGPFDLSDIGSPSVDTDYALCIYRSMPAIKAMLPATPAWEADADSLTYEDKTGAINSVTAAGIQVKFKEFVSATVSMSLGGDALELDLTPDNHETVIAEVRSEAGGCWGATFTGEEIHKNDGKRFVGKEKNTLP